MSRALSYWRVESVSPVNAIIVSRPQSVNHGSPASTVIYPVDCLYARNWLATTARSLANWSEKLAVSMSASIYSSCLLRRLQLHITVV